MTVAVLHIVSRRRIGETKIIGNGSLAFSTRLYVQLEMLSSSLFKRDTGKVNSGVSRIIVDVTVAVWHVTMKKRLGETKILGNAF